MPEQDPSREIAVLNRVIAGSGAAFVFFASALVVTDSVQFMPDCEEFVAAAGEENVVICAEKMFGYEHRIVSSAGILGLAGSGFLGASAIGRRRELKNHGGHR